MFQSSVVVLHRCESCIQARYPRIFRACENCHYVPLPFIAMSMKQRIRSFFSESRQYVVVGASNDPSKFGFKILSWYINHGLPVTPVNPKQTELLGQAVVPKASEVVAAILAKQDLHHHKLSQADGLSFSFLTPPSVTLATLEQVAEVPDYKSAVKGLWFQPGSYDNAVLAKVDALGLKERSIEEDECILVRGEEGMYSANL